MIQARAVRADHPSDLTPPLLRLGLPRSASNYLLEKIPLLQILLTGLTRREGIFLQDRRDSSTGAGFEEVPFYSPGNHSTHPGTALLSGRLSQFEALLDFASAADNLTEFALALRKCLDGRLGASTFRVGNLEMSSDSRTLVMGIVNVTPDSFSDGGRFFQVKRAIEHGLKLVDEGADLIDIGGESSRPGAEPVTVETELARVIPVVEGLRQAGVPLSIDTTKAQVAQEALRRGATLVNDISGFKMDSELAEVVAAEGASCCLMHLRGVPKTMQDNPTYPDVMDTVIGDLSASIQVALSAGIPQSRICIDPGIGFGKTLDHNIFLMRHLGELRALGYPILIGISRKAFLGTLTDEQIQNDRLSATLGAISFLASRRTVDIVRVHDVKAARDALAVVDAITRAESGGELYLRRRDDRK